MRYRSFAACALLALAACGNGPAEGPSRDAGPAEAAAACIAPDSDALAPAHKPLEEPPTHPVGGFSIDMGDPAIQGTELAPGAELFPCVVFPMKITGPYSSRWCSTTTM